MSNKKHIWQNLEISIFNICSKCKKSSYEIELILNKRSECQGQAKTEENVNKYYPCLSDEEVIIKNIIE